MTKVTIDRGLLERLAAPLPGDNGWQTWHTQEMIEASKELRAVLAAPRQPEGALEVVAYQSIDATRGGGWMAHKHALPQAHIDQGALQEPLCRLSDHQRAIAELREECEHLKDCQENDMLHIAGLVAERDTLRQQLAERDAEILEQCRLNGMGAERELKLMSQRDRLALLLRKAHSAGRSRRLTVDELYRIDAALAEVK